MLKTRIVRVGLLVLGLLILLGGGLLLLADPQKLKSPVEAALSEATQRRVSLETLSFQLFPPGFRGTGLVVSDDPAFSRAAFLRASVIEIRPKLLPLLSGVVEIVSVRLTEPQLELIANDSGHWNYASVGGRKRGAGSFTLGQLHVDRARVGVKQPNRERQEYSRLSAELRDYSDAKPFFVRVEAVMPNGEPVSASGRIAVIEDKTTFTETGFTLGGVRGKIAGEINAGVLKLNVEIPKSPIADMARLYLPKGMTVKGEIAARIAVTGTTDIPVMQGRADVSGFEVSGGAFKQPVKTAKLGIEFTPERISLEPANVSSGSTQLQAFGVISKYSSDPRLEATLIALDAQLSELLAVARVYGISAADGISGAGKAKLQVRAHGSLGARGGLEFSGNGALRDAQIEISSLTKSLTVRATDFRFEAKTVAFTNVDASIGSTSAHGELRVANFSRPAISFSLDADKLVLSELRGLLRETGSRASAQTPGMTAQGSLKIGTLDLVDLRLTQVSTQVDYRDGRARLSPLVAAIYGGQHNGSMDIDMRTNPPLYTLHSKLERIESGQLLGATTALKGFISGPMSGVVKLTFVPGEAAQIARSLNGTITLKVDQGRISTFNLTNELAVVAKFFGFNSTGEKFTQFLGISGDLTIVNGTASTQNLKLDLANLTAGLTGTMNLADQTLDMKLMSILDRKFSEMVGGSKIGGWMTAAMANGAGNLMIPASIKGTFANPIIAPDPGAIAKMKLQTINPKDPKQMMDEVNSILDLFKKKPAQQP